MGSIGKSAKDLERGFTLIELVVIVTIIGVLLAIGIPTLLGAKTRASDAAAKSAATRALKSQKVLYSDAGQSYGNASQVEEIEPSIKAEDYAGGVVPEVLGRVYIKNDAGAVATMVARSASGVCFWTRDANGVTSYAKNDCGGIPDDAEFGASW
jgi:type IV pilus assembly protein PilA